MAWCELVLKTKKTVVVEDLLRVNVDVLIKEMFPSKGFSYHISDICKNLSAKIRKMALELKIELVNFHDFTTAEELDILSRTIDGLSVTDDNNFRLRFEIGHASSEDKYWVMVNRWV